MKTRVPWGPGGTYPLPLILAWACVVVLPFLCQRIEAKQTPAWLRFLNMTADEFASNKDDSEFQGLLEGYLMKANDKEILDFLLHKANYDRRVRPPSGDTPLHVNVSVLLLSLSSPDESSLKYEVEFLLHTRWVDLRLKHDDGLRYPYLSGMHHVSDMWLPDIFLIKHGDFKEPSGPNDVALKIFRNGTIIHSRRRHLILSCIGDLNIFPFDDPFCQFSMESISYEAKDMTLDWTNDPASANGKKLAKSESLRELNAYIIHNETKDCDLMSRDSWRGFAGNYSCLQVNLKFSRDDAFYFSTVFIPGIILVTSSFITFWLEWNAVPARVMIGVTTMLNFFTTSNSFRSTLPVVSNLAAMNLWDSVCMFFIYVSLLEFVLVNYVGRKRPKHNMVYMPGENNAVIQVLNENRRRIPQAIQRIGVSLVSAWTSPHISMPTPETERRTSRDQHTEGGNSMGLTPGNVGEQMTPTVNSHDNVVSQCGNCGNSQCSHTNTPNCCSNGEEPTEMTQVEYTFNKRRNKDATHPIRMAKSIDVISRVVFPLTYSMFLVYFYYKTAEKSQR